MRQFVAAVGIPLSDKVFVVPDARYLRRYQVDTKDYILLSSRFLGLSQGKGRGHQECGSFRSRRRGGSFSVLWCSLVLRRERSGSIRPLTRPCSALIKQ